MSIIMAEWKSLPTGGANVVEGEFQSASGASVEVHDIGFKADYLWIGSQDTTKNYTTENMYVAEYPTQKFCTIKYLGNFNSCSCPTISTADTTRGTLLEITDDGFTWGPTNGNANYAAAPKFSYKAIKLL